jgi:CRP-like cAMP-binding protein
VVIAGEGEIYTGGDGARTPIGKTKTGDCVGELAVLDEAPRSATVQATSPMRVLAIGGQAFRDLLGRQPDLANAVISMLTRRLRNAVQRSTNAR